MFLSIGAGCFPRQIGDWPRVDHQIIGQRGSHEGERHPDALAFESVDRSRRQHRQIHLRQRRHAGWLLAHDAEGLAVNAHQAGEPMRLAGPVHRVRVRQCVSRRPDAEIGIAGNQWDGWQTKRVAPFSTGRGCDLGSLPANCQRDYLTNS